MLDNSDLNSLSSLEDGVEPDLLMVDDPCSPSSVSSSSTSSNSVRIRMKPEASDCQLSWSEHQSHLTDYFDSLFRRESLVDVTLICPDRTVRAHRVVLSACSSYLGRILADNPSHHPAILLPDVAGWELEALVRFMYRGEIEGVTREDLPALIRVAETLQVRGLTTLESSRPREPTVYLKKDLFGPSLSEDEHQPMTKMSRMLQNGYSFDHTSPLPRRKQARPRRRSGDSMPSTEPPFKSFRSTPSPVQDAPEDLSVKKSPLLQMMRQESSEETFNLTDTSREETPLPSGHHKAADSISVHSDKSEFSLAERNSLFSPGPSGPLMTPNSLLSMTPIHHQSDRRKGQHSAPRGGPPRAWTNGDLTEALNHVWNRKMTTSQASRVFGIPYNSLLMYVRGKYGKSLKLDTLRKETLEGEAMALAASTRGSYKLAAAAAAAAAAASKSETVKPAPPPATSTTTSPSAVAQPNHNNNNNNNNNNKEPKLSNKMNHYGDMESLGGFSAAGLTAGGFAPNPFLSYFCDFTFPGHHLGGGGGGHHLPVVVPGGMMGSKRHHRPMEKKIDLHPSSSDGKRNKEMPDMEEEDGPSPPPLRLGNRSLLPLDLPQPGHV